MNDNIKQMPKSESQMAKVPEQPRIIAQVPVPKFLVKKTYRMFDRVTLAKKKSGISTLADDHSLWMWVKKNILNPAGLTDVIIDACNIEFKIKSIYAPYIEVAEGTNGAMQQVQ